MLISTKFIADIDLMNSLNQIETEIVDKLEKDMNLI